MGVKKLAPKRSWDSKASKKAKSYAHLAGPERQWKKRFGLTKKNKKSKKSKKNKKSKKSKKKSNFNPSHFVGEKYVKMLDKRYKERTSKKHGAAAKKQGNLKTKAPLKKPAAKKLKAHKKVGNSSRFTPGKGQ